MRANQLRGGPWRGCDATLTARRMAHIDGATTSGKNAERATTGICTKLYVLCAATDVGDSRTTFTLMQGDDGRQHASQWPCSMASICTMLPSPEWAQCSMHTPDPNPMIRMESQRHISMRSSRFIVADVFIV